MKIELHLHTSEVSRCAHVAAADAVRQYKQNGYDAIVVTDHYSPYFIDICNKNGVNIKDEYLKGYRAACDAAKPLGIKVFLGCELCLCEAANDYLLYGVSEDMFSDSEILKMSVSQLSSYCRQKGILLYQAHPFRNRMQITKPDLLFGIEVNNGNPRHNSRNEISQSWAKMHGLHRISGSDYHQTEDIGRGGIITSRQINNENELVDMLCADDYSLITV